MSTRPLRLVLLCVGLALLLWPVACRSRLRSRTPSRPLRGVVATVHPLATQAGLDALAEGGNAVDAAVAAALTLGVVDGSNSGIGGGCFVLLRQADGTVLALDGREMAPAAAHRDMFLRGGKADPELSRVGALAVGVPGSLAVMDRVLTEAGRLSLAHHLCRAANLAEAGFPIGASLARRLEKKEEDLARFSSTAAIFLDAERHAWPKGHLLRQRDLARTYRAIARRGIGWFYGGAFACRLGRWMRAHGGLLTAKDVACYRVRERDPVVSTYRGYRILGFPPPSSGGVHVAQILTILETFDLAGLEREDGIVRRHVMAEAMKSAFADRAFWLGDADFVAVPRGLWDRGYCRSLAGRIDPGRATPVPHHGTPPRATTDLFERHTTHLAAADTEGNWVSMTTTLNSAFGSKVVLPGTGVLLNNQMDDFAAQPGVPNAFGLVGAKANAVAPRKRPLSSMSPTLVLRDGEPVLAVGGAGGPAIITQVVQVLVNWIDLGLTIEEAVAAPRIHHQWKPDELVLEASFGEETSKRLEGMGHEIRTRKTLGVTQAVLRNPDGSLTAVRDPRLE